MYQFKEPTNTACFVCDHGLNKERPILFVSHDQEDASWQFLCGEEDHTEDNIRIIGLGEVVVLDESLNALYEMPAGVNAERDHIGGKWTFYK